MRNSVDALLPEVVAVHLTCTLKDDNFEMSVSSCILTVTTNR